MDDGFQQITKGFFGATFDQFRTSFLNWKRKRRLRIMLNDKRFLKGFRGTQKLVEGIGADVKTTNDLLISMGARKSETSDEWTLRK